MFVCWRFHYFTGNKNKYYTLGFCGILIMYYCTGVFSGAFLIPYLVFVVTCGVPLFLLETAMGQYTQEGGITCWRRLCPLAEGESKDLNKLINAFFLSAFIVRLQATTTCIF